MFLVFRDNYFTLYFSVETQSNNVFCNITIIVVNLNIQTVEPIHLFGTANFITSTKKYKMFFKSKILGGQHGHRFINLINFIDSKTD
jgi:hypothetical protein